MRVAIGVIAVALLTFAIVMLGESPASTLTYVAGVVVGARFAWAVGHA